MIYISILIQLLAFLSSSVNGPFVVLIFRHADTSKDKLLKNYHSFKNSVYITYCFKVSITAHCFMKLHTVTNILVETVHLNRSIITVCTRNKTIPYHTIKFGDELGSESSSSQWTKVMSFRELEPEIKL